MIALRQLTGEDWPALKAIRLKALREEPGAFFAGSEGARTQPDAFWRELAAGRDHAIFGAFDDRTLVGITGVFTDRAADPNGGAALFGMTWLDPPYRGQGITRRYHRERIAWARVRGFALLTVSHRASNHASRRAILAAGFVQVGAQPYRWPDGAIVDDVLYEMRLGA